MSDRVQQTYALLRSMADWEPSPKIAVARGAERGESAGRLELCDACDGSGKRGGSTFPCRLCRGRGRVPVDPQTGRIVTDQETPIEQLIRRRRDRCATCGGSGVQSASSGKDPGAWRDVLELEPRTGRYVWRQERRPPCADCAGTGTREAIEMARVDRPRELDDTTDPLGLEAALERKAALWARGSYAHLDVRLLHLQAEYPWARRLLEVHVIHPIDARVSVRIVERCDWATGWLEQGLPWPIVVPAEYRQLAAPWATRQPQHGRTNGHQRARDARDATIRALHQAGAKVPQLTDRYGLSRTRLYEILAASGPAAQP